MPLINIPDDEIEAIVGALDDYEFVGYQICDREHAHGIECEGWSPDDAAALGRGSKRLRGYLPPRALRRSVERGNR